MLCRSALDAETVPFVHVIPAPTLRGYRRRWLAGDLLAGSNTAAIVVPQAMAYAVIAGLPESVATALTVARRPSMGLNVKLRDIARALVQGVSGSCAPTA